MIANKIKNCLELMENKFFRFYNLISSAVAPKFVAITILVGQFIISLGYLYIIPPTPITFNLILYIIVSLALLIALTDNIYRYVKYRKSSILKLFSSVSLFGILFIIFYRKYHIETVSTDDFHFGEKVVFFLQATNFELKYFYDMAIVHGFIDVLPIVFGSIIFNDTTITGYDLGLSLYYNFTFILILFLGSYIYRSFIFLIPLFYYSVYSHYTVIAVFALAILKFATTKLSNHRIIITLSIFVLFSYASYFFTPTVAVPTIIALSPMVIYYIYSYLRTNSNNKLNYLWLLIPFTIFSTIFIYFNSSIISSLKELLINSTVNLVAYGNNANIFAIIIRDQHYLLMPVFIIFLLSALVADKKDLRLIFTLSLIIIFTIFISSYLLGRLDGEGIRSKIILFSVTIPIILYILNIIFKRHKFIVSIILFAGISFFIALQKDTILAFPTKINSDTNYSKSNPLDSEFPHVGISQMQLNHKQYMLKLRDILSKHNIGVSEYLDLTNRGATYFYLQRKLLIPYLAYYNIGSEQQSVRAINSLKKNIIYPKLVLLSPAIAHDYLKIPIRGNLLYRYLLLSGKYTIITEDDFTYLLHKEGGHTPTKNELILLNDALKIDLNYAPDVFGSSINKLKKDLAKNTTVKHKIKIISANKIEINFEKPIDMRSIDFIYFSDSTIRNQKKYAIYLNSNPELGVIYFISSKDKKLVQLDVVPSIMLSKNIDTIIIESDKRITIKDIRFYKRVLNIKNNL